MSLGSLLSAWQLSLRVRRCAAWTRCVRTHTSWLPLFPSPWRCLMSTSFRLLLCVSSARNTSPRRSSALLRRRDTPRPNPPLFYLPSPPSLLFRCAVRASRPGHHAIDRSQRERTGRRHVRRSAQDQTEADNVRERAPKSMMSISASQVPVERALPSPHPLRQPMIPSRCLR